jgi:opacity protein-like surface antigen
MATSRVPSLPGRSCACSSKSRVTATALLSACVLLLPAPARADFFLTPFAAIKFAGSASIIDLESGASNTKFALGGMAGFLGDGVLGAEADVTYVPRFFERSSGSLVARSHVLTFMGNVMLAAPRSATQYSLRPFVSGGAGLMQINIDDVADVIPIDTNLFGVNVGGGATGPLTNMLDVRFELRWFKSVTTGDATPLLPRSALSFWRAAIGFTIR